jgi:lipopolysaccharide transport system ATP-binding protein
MSDIAIKLENISKFYKLYKDPKDRLKEALHPLKKKYHRKFFALKNINLEVKKGEILGLVGRNGAGKSTLLKLISGIIQPSSGRIAITGNISALLELGSGLNPEFTGIQNIYFSGTMMGFSREEMKKKVDDIVTFADIGDFIHQPLKTYSSGMKARLGFALAVNIDPEILILDEVLSVGDDLFRRKCYTKMEELFKANCTVFYVSHSIGTVTQICSRAILVDKGEIILEGSPKLVTMHYQKYLFVKPEEAEKTRNEIIQLNNDENKKKNFAVESVENKNTAIDEKKQQMNEEKQKTEAYFIPDFKPKSTVVTRNYDVDIYDLHIRTPGGKRVNALVMNEEYIYSFKVKFNIEAAEVGIGVPFKTEKGLLLTNHNLYGNYIEKVEKGSTLLIDCHFRCIFTPGIYYTNATVGAAVKGKRAVLNRIVDAMAFKVQLTGKEGKYRGLVYCDQSFDIKKI